MGSTNNAAADTAVKNMTNRSDLPASVEEGFFDSPLSGSVEFDGDNNPDDVFKVSEALVANDRLDQPASIADDAFNSKIITVQEDMADGLKPDGLVNPGGPTEKTFTKLVDQDFMKAPVSDHQRTATPTRAEREDIDQREKAQHDQIIAAQEVRQQSAQQTKQTKDTVIKAAKGVANLLKQVSPKQPEHHSGAGQNQPLAPEAVAPRLRGDDKGESGQQLLPISDEVFSANQRTAQYLASRDGIGDLSKFIAEGIEADGDKAIAETVDLYHQTAGLNQKQADALINKVITDLSSENAKRLKSVIMPFSAGTDNSDGSYQFGDEELEGLNAIPPVDDGEDFAVLTEQDESRAGDIDSEPFQPMPVGGADHLPNEGVKSETNIGNSTHNRKNLTLEDFEWNKRSAKRHINGMTELKVKGPIKIQGRSVSMGQDGVSYEVDWYPLDENGKVLPKLTNPNSRPKRHTAPTLFSKSPRPLLHTPPYDNPNGFLVEVRTPPQQSPNGASLGVDLDIFTTKDGDVLE